MKTSIGPRGRQCASDPRIVFHRFQRGEWWVSVARFGPRGGLAQPLTRSFRTLRDAKEWARRHWEPDFLRPLLDGFRYPFVPNQNARRLWQGVRVTGDRNEFSVMLDAVEDMQTLDRDRITRKAERERVFDLS
jgi:hypothetical protein